MPTPAPAYEQSLAILRSAGDRAWESIALVRMGLLFQRLDELERARDYGRQALSIARSIGHRDYESAALAQLGHYHKALALREAMGQLPGLPELWAGMAWITVQQCQVD
jgi:tetratricopeptide (TPR) repeat protein